MKPFVELLLIGVMLSMAHASTSPNGIPAPSLRGTAANASTPESTSPSLSELPHAEGGEHAINATSNSTLRELQLTSVQDFANSFLSGGRFNDTSVSGVNGA